MHEQIETLIRQAEEKLAPAFKRLEAIEESGTRRVLMAFQEHQVAYRHFAPTTGYGYDDVGRDTLEKIFADLFGTEAAIVRPHIVFGHSCHFLVSVRSDPAGRSHSFGHGQAL